MPRLLVITNKDAGSEDDAQLDQALQVLREGADVEVVATADPDDLDRVLSDRDGRTLVVAGGDGSLHAIVTALQDRDEKDVPFGLLPLGTGNDFARGVDIPLDPEGSARVILDSQPRPVDLVIDDQGNVVVNSVHVGASAHASRKAALWKARLRTMRLGLLGYPIGTAVSALNPPLLRLDVEIDGELVADTDSHVLMVAIGNGSTVGGGMSLTPDAEPEDGKLDVMVSHSIGRITRLVYVWDLVRGAHRHRRDVTYRTARSVRVSGQEFYVSADGELSGPVSSRLWTIYPGVLSMHLPG